ncbi:MAG TPA: FAD:protein FMN transferase [Urbifossiella sp.]|nr:FAD:protein FMN transferase [Urbifossiella sp.]
MSLAPYAVGWMLELLFHDDPAPSVGYALVRVSRRAMATTFEVALPYGTRNAIPAAEAALDLIDDLEDQLTVYRDHSEISHLNAAGAAVVEPQLFDLLARCAGWTRETDGAFDIATGALIKAWGFYRREGRIPTAREQADAMSRTGMRHVVLNENAVRFRAAGLEINLGAVGKGYALDRAAALLRRDWGVRSALLHGGGSSVLAIGTPPDDPRGWPIRLRHPTANQSVGTVYLNDRGLGTSAATFQFFEYNGRKYGHVLDPRTGRPAEGVASASATAPTAVEADAMSTAAFVAGPALADRLTRTRPHLGAVVLADDADAPLVFNLAPDEYAPPDPA